MASLSKYSIVRELSTRAFPELGNFNAGDDRQSILYNFFLFLNAIQLKVLIGRRRPEVAVALKRLLRFEKRRSARGALNSLFSPD